MHNAWYHLADEATKREARNVWGHNITALMAAAEITYYEEYGKLPEWAVVYERIEIVNDARLYIAADPTLSN